MSNRRPGAPRAARRPVSGSGARASSARKPARPSGSSPRTAAKSATGSRSRGPASASRPRSTAPRGPEGDALGVTITRRTLALIALVVIALAALVPTVNSYVAQRQQLSELRAQVDRQEQDVETLREQVARWDDPAYVAARARERLLFAMPGETQYRLTDTSGQDVPLTEAERAAEEAQDGEWFSTLWQSVEGSSRLTPEDSPDESGSTDEDAADEPTDQDPDQ